MNKETKLYVIKEILRKVDFNRKLSSKEQEVYDALTDKEDVIEEIKKHYDEYGSRSDWED